MSAMLYPWQQAPWRRLLSDLESMHHALLLHGPEGGGKGVFAETLAARLLCERAQGADLPCGQCQSCQWLKAGHHPDYRVLMPEALGEAESAPSEGGSEGGEKKLSQQIRIEQVRELAQFLVVGTHKQGRRLVVLRPVEAMNVHTANSLLKLLEEPLPGTVFVLVTHNLSQLLPTVRSRCRLLRLGKPERASALSWLGKQNINHPDQALALAGGMPLQAAQLASGELLMRHTRLLAALSHPEGDDPLRLAAELEGWLKQGKDPHFEAMTLVDWLQKWVYDMVRVRSKTAPVFHPHEGERLNHVANKAELPSLFACYNDLQRARSVARHSLNMRLFLEDMLMRYWRLFVPSRSRALRG